MNLKLITFPPTLSEHVLNATLGTRIQLNDEHAVKLSPTCGPTIMTPREAVKVLVVHQPIFFARLRAGTPT